MFTRAVVRLSRKRPPSEYHVSDGLHGQDQNLKGSQKWATSLDNLLADPEGVAEFTDFLKREFSEENLLFWLACEDFKKTEDLEKMKKKAKDIYTRFLSSKASSPVNVEGQSRIGEQMLKQFHPLMFEKLQEQIFNLMKYDSYGRFLKSEKFQKLKTAEDDESSAPRAGESAPKRASIVYNT
ncbi:regulator of G-protein signaling 10 [Pseudophryne corroboree]|uniref:regulator of G-protein signaling 10 n=1 Tax=Pseudophryne corroboree TaxID=495146 RepID=UPI0030815106